MKKQEIRKQVEQVTSKQALGAFFLCLSLFTYLGGLNYVYSAASLGCSLKVTVKDSDTGDPVQGADVTLTGFDYQDLQYVTLNMPIGPTDSDGKCNAGASMWGTYYLEASKTGYESKSFTMSGDESSTVRKTVYLTPESSETPEDPVDEEPEDPIDDDPEEPTDPEEPSDPEEPTDPDDEPITVVDDSQMDTWENMLSGSFAVLGIGLLTIDFGEKHR